MIYLLKLLSSYFVFKKLKFLNFAQVKYMQNALKVYLDLSVYCLELFQLINGML